MVVEVAGPACLVCGVVRVAAEGEMLPCLVGVTLQHPPVHLSAQLRHPPEPGAGAGPGLRVSGARSPTVYRFARRFLAYHHLPRQAEVQVEWAIPAGSGLGAEVMPGLCVAQALANLYADMGTPGDGLALAQALALEPHHALAVRGFEQGGALVVGARAVPGKPALPVISRHEIAHPEGQAWVFVLFFPRLPGDTPETLEEERLQMLLRVAPLVSDETDHLVRKQFWPALEQNDFPAFARTLMHIHHENDAALRQAGEAPALSPEAPTILAMMRDYGALAWGHSLTGLALYGVIEGAEPALALRGALRRHVGPYGGIVITAITSNVGRQVTSKDAC
ncbi:MAG: hypothetical protein HC884_12870 [Chloroflexaceae bacterium]|nr:hypothetical protein [Chloroflexaceae bacterium]